MKALLKDNFQWVDIDTDCIFNNQYNTKDSENGKGKRIFDSDVIRFENDLRILNPEFCHCSYCGKQFLTRADYNKHLEEENSKARKSCKGCFWHNTWRETNTETKLLKIVFNPDGSEEKTEILKTNISYTDKGCSHITNYGCCEYEEHSHYSARTFENCYFVKHPYGKLFDTVKPINNHYVYGSWYLDVEPETLNWRLHNTREEFKGTAKINENNVVKSLGIATLNKTLDSAQDYARSCIESYAKEIVRFNEMVSDDRYYTNSDGTKLETVVINGTIYNRPEPIKTDWICWIAK